MNLFKPLGGLIYTALLTALTGAILWALVFFVYEMWAWVVSAVLLALVFVVTTRPSVRILSLTEDEGAWWVAFTTTILSAVLWGEYVLMESVRERMGQIVPLVGESIGDSLSVVVVTGQRALLAVVLFQIALLVGAYALLWPGVKGGLLNKNRLVLPLTGSVIGGVLGWSAVMILS